MHFTIEQNIKGSDFLVTANWVEDDGTETTADDQVPSFEAALDWVREQFKEHDPSER